MRPNGFTFRREALWMLALAGGPPAVGILCALAWPTVARWLAPR